MDRRRTGFRYGGRGLIEQALLSVRVTPRSSRNRIEVSEDGAVKIWVTASPTDNQANLAVCELLAKKLGVPKSAASVSRGQASRDKLVAIHGLSLAESLSRLRSE